MTPPKKPAKPQRERRAQAFTDRQIETINLAITGGIDAMFDKMGITSDQLVASHKEFARVRPLLASIQAEYDARALKQEARRRLYARALKMLEDETWDGIRKLLRWGLVAIVITAVVGYSGMVDYVAAVIHKLRTP